MIATFADTLSRDLKNLEQRLQRQKNDKQRLALLDQLAEYYTYTDCTKANKYLDEIRRIIKAFPEYHDFQLNYYLHTAFVENQLYNFLFSKEHFIKAIELLEEVGTLKQQAEAFIDFAGTLINLKELDQAHKQLEKAKSLLLDFPDEILQIRILCRQGSINLYYRNFPAAIEQFLEADKRLDNIDEPLSVKDYYFKTIIYSSLGRIYEDSEEHKRSVKAYLKVINWCETLHMRTRLSWHYLNVGNAYMALQELENAELFFKKSLKVKFDISQNSRAAAYANLGSCFFLSKKYDEALQLFKKAEYIYKEKPETDIANLAELESRKAKVFIQLGKLNKAEKHLHKAYEFAWTVKDYKRLSAVCKEIAEFYAEHNNFEDAYNYLYIHGQMEEKRIEEMNRRMILEMEVKYEAAKKQQETEMLRLQAVGLQLKALRAQMNPHFIYNALNAIQNYITSNELSSATKYLAIFARLMRQSLEFSDREYVSLEDEIEFLQNYLFLNQQLRYQTKLTYKISVHDELEEDIMGLPAMIVQPYVENALEHGLRTVEKGLLTLEFSLMDDEHILCVVQDNGIGRGAAKQFKDSMANAKHRSMGTAITEKRLEILSKSKHNNEMNVKTIDLKDDQDKPCGTRVEIVIPITIIQK
ncbi:MAG TPA: tetratricopeptide repeat protein [Phaeodactylibacter sp.]|nr:tetratricopeptide repeat protein [Phaeodactylibacter sp.]